MTIPFAKIGGDEMKCSQARELMSLEIDNAILPGDAAQMHAHLNECSSCAAYWGRLKASMSLLDSHSQLVARESADHDLDLLTHNALSGEASSSRYIEYGLSGVCGLIRSLFPARAWSCAMSLSVAALLITTSYVLVSHAIDVAPSAAGTCQLSHIQSFSAEMDSQGRVYAAIIERNSTFSSDGGRSK